MDIWQEYYEELNIKDPNSIIRQRCEPKIKLHQDSPTEKAIVLIHGLTDSPFFMEAIGECFHSWGYNVFIPLLAGHGLKDPKGLKGVSLDAWKKNVNFAIQEAQKHSTKISIGGLSTGGSLSVLKMFESPDEITGNIFLFSAALDIAGVAGNIVERLLRTRIILPILAQTQDWYGKELVGDNPYRYSRMDNDGARELSKLILEIDKYIKKAQTKHTAKPIFAVHSEYDSAADIKGVEKLIANSKSSKTEFFRIGKYFHVPHASVVLKDDVRAKNNSPLEPKNPFFDDMINAIYKFQI